MKHVVIGTAGHIDHGKSSLVEALTGTHPDRWEEEKRRGITIDLGFAFLDLGEVGIGFVDVPGHERFVKNMLAGAGGIDAVVLVIAADESIKPQTREHFDICRLLGIPRGIIAITKSDLVNADALELVRLEAEEFARGTFLDRAPVVYVSARTGVGLDRLREELRRIGAESPVRDPARPFRLAIDRSFPMRGFGAVVTGTLLAGSVAPEDEVELFPAGRMLRVRGVHSGGRAVARAVAGQRTAINLAGIAHEEVGRGMTLAAPGRFAATIQLDAQLTLLPASRPLKRRSTVHFHHGSAECTAQVILLEQEKLAPGESGWAQLQLGAPVLALPGDRFILRQFSPVTTIGGGVVLDAHARRHKARDVSYRALLHAFAEGTHAVILQALCASEPRGLTHDQIVRRTGWTDAEVQTAAPELLETKAAILLNEAPLVLASAAAFERCVRGIAEELDRYHQANPLAPGVPREELRMRAARHAGPEIFRAALDHCLATGSAEITGDLVRRAGREIALLPEELQAKEAIAAAFAKAGLKVPPAKEVLAGLRVDARRAQKILQLLIREQTLVKVGEELLFHRAAITQLKEMLAAHKEKVAARISVPAFKEMAGISRKYAIPLLEYLDRERVTRRTGDERVIL